jgi:hypothetical protein
MLSAAMKHARGEDNTKNKRAAKSKKDETSGDRTIRRIFYAGPCATTPFGLD